MQDDDSVVSVREVKCPRCYGTGEDPKVEDADCLECWGDGTILLED